jgi:uroporphyrinogen-III decarboxylase
MGVDFTIIEGKGPKIANPIRSEADIKAIKPLYDIESQVPFLGEILKVKTVIKLKLKLLSGK